LRRSVTTMIGAPTERAADAGLGEVIALILAGIACSLPERAEGGG
jgi:hypothetical protein